MASVVYDHHIEVDNHHHRAGKSRSGVVNNTAKINDDVANLTR